MCCLPNRSTSGCSLCPPRALRLLLYLCFLFCTSIRTLQRNHLPISYCTVGAVLHPKHMVFHTIDVCSHRPLYIKSLCHPPLCTLGSLLLACVMCSFRACLVCSFRACLECSFRASGSLRFARSLRSLLFNKGACQDPWGSWYCTVQWGGGVRTPPT